MNLLIHLIQQKFLLTAVLQVVVVVGITAQKLCQQIANRALTIYALM